MTDEERRLVALVHEKMGACIMHDEPPTIGDVVEWAHTLTDALAADRPKIKVFAQALSADRINPQRVWREGRR